MTQPIDPAKTRESGFRSNAFDPPDLDGLVTYATNLATKPLEEPAAQMQHIDAETAFAAVEKFGISEWLQPGEPVVHLRLASVGFEGQDATFRFHPAWVFTWLGGQVALRAGRMSAERRAEIVASTRCVFVMVVDADTGVLEAVHQICGGS